MRYAWKSMLLCACLLLGTSLAYGQRDGILNFSASESHDLDSINLSTLVPSLNIPLVGKGAGVLPGSIAVESSQSCRPYNTGLNNGVGITCGYYSGGSSGSILASFYFIPVEMMGLQVNYTWVTSGQPPNQCTTYTISGFQGLDQLTNYEIANTPVVRLYYPSVCGVNTATINTVDGTGLTVALSSVNGAPTITSASNNSGWTETFGLSSNTVTDPFGNTIVLSTTSFTDSLGAATTLTGGIEGVPSSYQYTDTGSNSRTISLVNGTAKTFYPFNDTCGIANANSSVTPISSISYPDGTSVSFTWDTTPISGHSGTLDGLIKSYTLRSGGTVTFTYGSLQNNCGSGGQFEGWAYGTLTRTTPDGSTTYTNSTVNNNTTTTVLDPGKNKTVYTFNGNPSSAGAPTPAGGNIIQTIYRYQNTGTVASPVYTLISNTKYCYNTDTHCDGTVIAQYPITQRDTYEYVGASSTQMSHRVQTFDSTYGVLLTDATTDSTGSGQTKTTTYVYGTDVHGTCQAISNSTIHDHPCTVTTSVGGNNAAITTYTYNSNGGLTEKDDWTGTNGSSFLVTTYTVNTNGTIASVTAPNGQVTTNTYGNCNNLLLTDSTTTVNSIAIDNKTTWDCNGAVPVDTTDPNGNEADTTYDVMFRPASQTDRMEQTTTFSYGGTTNNYFTSTDPLGIIRYRWTDGLGRTTLNQVRQSPSSSNYDTVSTVYQWNGTNFQTQTTVPCVQTYGNGCPATYTLTMLSNPIAGPISTTDANNGTTTYGLGFSSSGQDVSMTAGPAPSGEHVKTNQTEIDGFGRIKSTCLLETSGGTSCGQALGNSGILTSTSYSFASGSSTITSTRGSQTHTTVADALGRTTSTTTPEAGTVTRYYDTIPASCYQSGVNESGFLTATKDNAGNYVCPETDGIGRVYAVGSGSYCKRFQYDSISSQNGGGTTPSGYPSTGGNIVGRLVEAETDNCGTPRVTSTDEWFAYDKVGNMTDMWESTPNSSGYYHTTATYDADGNVLTLSGIPSTSTLTFTMDGEGRPFNSELGSTWIVGSSSTTGVSYDAASRPLTVPINSASGHSDVFSYDNVGNMTGYTFSGNSKSMAGTLTWNSNGTLRSLGITDTFNSGGAQTCTYGTSSVAGYDDVGRLLDDNCGSSLLHDSWTYDQYDNATRTGNPGTNWQPGYSSSNNEMTGSSYDSNGNLTYDGVNSYAFDVYNKMSGTRTGNNPITCGTNANCPVYDAFGQIVEIDYGSSSKQEMLVTPMGRVAYMSGQTVGTLYIPQPGGGVLYANGGTNYFLHPDWLGTKRLGTNLSTGAYLYDTAFTPYGESYNTFGTFSIPDFTGLNPDIFGGLFDTPNRELATNSSRWLSPDPAHASWNAYSYVTNPNSQIDRSGLGDTNPTWCPPGDACDGAAQYTFYVKANPGTDTSDPSNMDYLNYYTGPPLLSMVIRSGRPGQLLFDTREDVIVYLAMKNQNISAADREWIADKAMILKEMMSRPGFPEKSYDPYSWAVASWQNEEITGGAVTKDAAFEQTTKQVLKMIAEGGGEKGFVSLDLLLGGVSLVGRGASAIALWSTFEGSTANSGQDTTNDRHMEINGQIIDIDYLPSSFGVLGTLHSCTVVNLCGRQ